MRCKEINELLSAYFDGMLEPSDRKEVDLHLDTCPDCRMELEELSMIAGLVGNLPLVEPPVKFGRDLRLKLESLGPPVSSPGFLKKLVTGRRSTLVALAASFLLVFGVAGAWPRLTTIFSPTVYEAGVQISDTGSAPASNDSNPSGQVAGKIGSDQAEPEKTLSASNTVTEKPKDLKREVKLTAKATAPPKTDNSKSAQGAEKVSAPPRSVEPGSGDVARGAAPGGHLFMKAMAPAPAEKTFLTIKSDDVGAAMRRISDVARMIGGSVSVPEENVGREMTVSIPGSQYDMVMTEISKTGTVTRQDPSPSGSGANGAAPGDQIVGIASTPTVTEVYGKNEADTGITTNQDLGAGGGDQNNAVQDGKSVSSVPAGMSEIIISFE